MPAAARVVLPTGLWCDGRHAPVRALALRPVGGEDEAFLLDTADGTPPGIRATALLARCLVGEESGDGVVRALTVGDREALLLHLRRLTFGDAIDCLLRCPADRCGEPMDLALRVRDLLVQPYDDVRREHEMQVDDEDARWTITFRLPTAGDLERVAGLGANDPEHAARELLRACLLRSAKNGGACAADALPAGACRAVAAAMVERDPQAEVELELACPVCGSAFVTLFDTATFFLQELDARAMRLLQEVHLLASHYHWSEREILQLPIRRRAHYLELVMDARARARPAQ